MDNLRPIGRISLLLIILLAFGLRVYRLDAQSLWWDELYTLNRSAMTLAELIDNLFSSRVHYYARNDWKAAFIQIEAARQPNDLLLLAPTQMRAYGYYGVDRIPYVDLPDLLECGVGTITPTVSSPQQCINEQLQAQVDRLSADVERVWLMSAYPNNNAHGFPQARNEIAALALPNIYEHWFEQEHTIVDQWQFTGMRLALYNLSRDQSICRRN